MPKVSIIIPAFNAAKTIVETLKSTQTQDFQDFEVIVVDDGSTDATVEVVRREFPDVRVIQQENAGPAAARNHGAAEAQGEWLAFLDADDIWLPWRLSLQLKLAEQHPEAVMWCAKTLDMDEDEPSPPNVADISYSEIPLQTFTIRNPVATTTVLLKRETFLVVEAFDTQFRGPEDYDLWMRVVAQGKAFQIDFPLSRYRYVPGSLSLDDRKFLNQVLAVIDKAFSEGGVLKGLLPPRKAKAYQYESCSWMAYCRGDIRRAFKLLLKSYWFDPFNLKSGGKLLEREKLIYRYGKGMFQELGKKIKKLISDWREFRNQPRVSIDLMLEKTEDNHEFFKQLVLDFYQFAHRRHRKLPLFRNFTTGIAITALPETFDDYFMHIEAAARRNFKKANRKGYRFELIDYNQYLDEITEIIASADYRQGEMPDHMLSGERTPCNNPESTTPYHDYPYFGVFSPRGKLVAYAGCFIAGEYCNIEQIYGHAQFQRDGVVPLLIISIAKLLYENHPQVGYFGYGAYFGAYEPMRRFKRKFDFSPHRVLWRLNTESKERAIYEVFRQERSKHWKDVQLEPPTSFFFLDSGVSGLRYLPKITRFKGLLFALKSVLKLCTKNRFAYGITVHGKINHLSWTTKGQCRHYRIEENSVVIGPIWTATEARGRGFATTALKMAQNELVKRKMNLFYIDADQNNAPSLKVIHKCGFDRPYAKFNKFTK
jgi:glycosyltransferase involved in cell wall biosynthesis